jgi:hypothetical protein
MNPPNERDTLEGLENSRQRSSILAFGRPLNHPVFNAISEDRGMRASHILNRSAIPYHSTNPI